ncbi:NADP-dependent oxidoreductase [Pseudonocardia endophytica]|uniref:NADPH:quinone reductase-like Zn-dependent oxidoreductase n=1 Tax=Pseudonocardia endophytica TaxID=401976 RepID=A0A4R1I431_PSEEN|nr:NADP-dependent oxidoreductase [Pseudonocardia endophytica]TCK27289.1 NADPH:quinone reductase-like Zn-dependent oxidoreductase [Pseudonocardia endophytica]
MTTQSTTARAVRFDGYGDRDVLYVTEIPVPEPAPDGVVVEVRATSINIGEAKIRNGALAEVFPATFPSGEGSDLAGVVTAVGSDVTGVDVGDQVVGWSDGRAAHATHVAVPAAQVVAKPAGLDWDVAGSLYVAGMAAVASVESVDPQTGETVVLSGATGGVGIIAAQLLRRKGVEVIAVASARNQDWLRTLGVTPVAYGTDGAETLSRIREAVPDKVHAWVDVVGGGYVDLAIELGVPADRINTIADYGAVQKHGVRGDGTSTAASAENVAFLAGLAGDGDLELPIVSTYPLDQVRDAYAELEQGHTRGKIVLHPQD